MTAEPRVIDGRVERLVFLCFRFDLRVCRRDDDHQWRETSHQHVVTAASWDDAFAQAKAARDVLVQNYGLGVPEGEPKPYLGSMHIFPHVIEPLVEGRPTQRGALGSVFGSFEWKCDFPGTIDQWFASFAASGRRTISGAR